ncbi:uncharacterized protein ACIBXB_018876 isoform 2-T2 [Morphnus guianensis]
MHRSLPLNLFTLTMPGGWWISCGSGWCSREHWIEPSCSFFRKKTRSQLAQALPPHPTLETLGGPTLDEVASKCTKSSPLSCKSCLEREQPARGCHGVGPEPAMPVSMQRHGNPRDAESYCPRGLRRGR